MVRVAQIGAGYWGKNLVRVFARIGALEAVCDADTGVLSTIAGTYTDVKTTEDYSAVLADGDIDAVSIAVPAARHYKLAKQALLAGKHVFVEKPMALSSVEAEELGAIAGENNLRLMVGHILLYHNGVRRVKELVDGGELGDAYYFYSQRVNLGRRCGPSPRTISPSPSISSAMRR